MSKTYKYIDPDYTYTDPRTGLLRNLQDPQIRKSDGYVEEPEIGHIKKATALHDQSCQIKPQIDTSFPPGYTVSHFRQNYHALYTNERQRHKKYKQQLCGALYGYWGVNGCIMWVNKRVGLN